MSKHMRLVVSVLFIVVIFLAIAITRFYSKTSRSTSVRNTQTDIERRLSSDSSGNRIFEDSSSLYGIIDSSDRVIVAAEWRELSFAGDGRCIASKRIGGTVLKGCIDYEGNVIVPFIYQNITSREYGDQTLYIAESGTDDSVILYDSSFKPVFRRVWKSCDLIGNDITLKSSSGTYAYSVSGEGMTFKSAEVNGEALGCEIKLEVSDQSCLALLDPDMLEYMTGVLGHYLEFAYTGDGSYVSDIRTGGKPAFTRLFPEDKKITERKLTGVKNVRLSLKKSDSSDVPGFEITASAGTEITYSEKEDGRAQKLTGDYKAAVEFSGTSVNDIEAVSGAFSAREPDYPKPEEPGGEGAEDSGQDQLLIPGAPRLLENDNTNDQGE